MIASVKEIDALNITLFNSCINFTNVHLCNYCTKIFVIIVNTCVCRRSVDNKALILSYPILSYPLYSFFASLTYALHSLIKLLKRNPFILYFVRISLKAPYIKKNTHSKTSSLCNFCSPKLDVRKSEKMAENNVHVTCTVLTGEVDLFDKM